MRTSLFATVTIAALLAGAQGAAAQSVYGSAPFREHPVELAQAAALERIEIFARAASIAEAGDDDEENAGQDIADDETDDESGPQADFALVRASLAAVAPELADDLGTAIDEMVEGEEGGDDAGNKSQALIGLVALARGRLPTAAMADDPGFRAALIASLLLDEGGVAEGYEEAVGGEGEAYAVGYFALQRVKALWSGLSGKANPEQAAGVAAMVAMLDELFPGESPPQSMSPDPEQAEAPAQQFVGLIEAVSNADLYPGRDLAGAARMVREIAASGCEAIAAQDGGVGFERIRVASAYYAQTIEATLGVMAPEAASAVAEGLEALGDPDADAAACAPLLAALEAGQEKLTP